MIEVRTRRSRCQPNGIQVALHRLFDPALRLKNMSFVNQTQRILFRCVRFTSAAAREGLSGRTKSIKAVSNFLVESKLVDDVVMLGLLVEFGNFATSPTVHPQNSGQSVRR